MATRLVLPGVEVPTEKKTESLLDGMLRVETVHTARVDLTARGTVPVEHRLEGVEPGDLVELEWEGGVREWTSVERLRQGIERQGLDRSVRRGELRVPAARRGPRSRGAFSWVLRGLKVLRVDLPAELADLSARALVERFEGTLQPGPGLYRCPADLSLGREDRLEERKIATDRPALVLLHGTASSTLGSFGKLAGTREWDELRTRYGDNLLALEHRSLSSSPLDNAIDLLEQLPPGLELHLVTHSRGGLVGELICRGEVSETDLEPFERAGRKDDVRRFLRLAALLRERQPRVKRFVRAACPARGTLLAGDRLDRYLSLLLNLFGVLPDLAMSPLYEVLRATLLALARKRAEPQDLPGLEAQRPESPIIHLLNRPGITSQADLAVLAGDVQGDGLWGRLTTFATDLFYREDHDLVVNTESMYGGVNRAGKTFYFFDKGPEVNHFGYFGNAATRARLLSWLTRKEGESDPLFQEMPPGMRRGASAERLRTLAEDRTDRPVLFLIPDFLGSSLRDRQGRRVWPDLESLALGGVERLVIDQRVLPDALVEPYTGLTQYLQLRYQVMVFPYDWRRSVLETGAELAAGVRSVLDDHGRPVHLLAHGMGGLVARSLIANYGEVWKTVAERGGRLLTLGSPHAGSHFALRLLLGQERLVGLWDLLDIGHTRPEILGVLARFPGLLEMLPEDREIDPFDPERWPELLRAAGFSRAEAEQIAPAPEDLRQARATRKQLEQAARSIPPGSVVSVQGSAPWTPGRLSGVHLGVPVFEGTGEGDGRVFHSQSHLAEVPAWYAEGGHGELVLSRAAFPAYTELLEEGRTEQLSARPPERRSLMAPPAAESEAPLLFPDEEDLLSAALGYEPAPPLAEDLLALRLSVAHGDLSHARFPLAVGHYEHDTIVSAERLLDRRLNGALTERYRLGLYPGPVGTVEVIFTPDASPPGALVIGLGGLGEVSPHAVTAGVLQAALRYALQIAERPATAGEGNRWRSAAFSALLLGTGGGRSITVEESVAAMVRGVIQANRALRSQGLWDRVRIDELELVELYEAVAIRAARAARTLGEHLRMSLEPHERIEAAPHLRHLPGGRVRPPVSQYDTGWWRRLQITATRGGLLSFEVLTERARTEQRQQYLQQSLVDGFVEETENSTDYSREVTSTLFELLLPNDLKDQAHEQTDVVLLLDDITAQYPWELLTERLQGRSEPFATSAGLIRQLRTREGEFRAMVRAPRDRFALVVGDPQSNHPELPGAQTEAKAVAEVLQAAGYDSVSLIRPFGWAVVQELFAREYQILHLAAHGLYEEGQPFKSGVVLGKDLFLTTAEMRQLRAVPPFVFLNCCHLGQVDRRTQFARLAASLATELICMGVRAVVAAGWAVDDQLATLFATELYQGLLSGQTFGRAVLRARQATYKAGADKNTWGAYQCYGDPDFVLDLRPAQRAVGADPRGFVSPREFLEEVSNLRSDAGGADLAGWDVLRRRLDELESTLPPDWRTGELLAALAGARGDVGAWWQAIQGYREALDAWGAEVPMQAVQTLANLEIRYAARLRRDGVVPPGVEDPKELVAKARRRLQWLIDLGETPERLALLGSAYKRVALAAATLAERKAALRKAADSYAKAHRQALEKKKVLDPYVALNWIACRHLLGDEARDELLGLLAECERVGAQLAAANPKFYHRLHVADAALHRHLILGDLADQEAALVERYRRALATGSASTEAASVAEHLELLILASDQKAPQVLHALRRIADSLGGRG